MTSTATQPLRRSRRSTADPGSGIDRACPQGTTDDETVPKLLRDVEADAISVVEEPAEESRTRPPALKRAFDAVAAALLLIGCSPLLLVIAVVSKLTQPGPLLYRQERIGLNGQSFEILKFRSMRIDAEKGTGPVFAVGNDPRCTRFGRWLRRSCCDELPQLINVLRGEMSLVGPRPERPVFVDEFRRSIPRYDERHAVRPGITGWAQVNGWRGDNRFDVRLQFDLDYVRRSSLLFDLRILLRTPWTIIRPRQILIPEIAIVRFPGIGSSSISTTEPESTGDAAQPVTSLRRAA